jgi:putative addiction module killer protein
MEVEPFVMDDGRCPFLEWLESLSDTTTRARIKQRIGRLMLGNLGDTRSIGGGVWELRLHFGAGHRVYFGLRGSSILVLLCGGDKSTQGRDIDDAKRYWKVCEAREARRVAGH